MAAKKPNPKRSPKQKLSLRDILNFNGSVRIPVSESVPLADEVRLIIDTPVFQRLRGVRQLGPTHFVYPGAVHTRFEHSLGTYALSLRYAEALLRQDAFYQLGNDPTEMAQLLIASALLHDIGHYPFSHLVEEIGDLPNAVLKRHEERAESLIMESEICSIFEQHWKVAPEDVCRAIRNTGELKGGFAVMATALDSVLDLDKMDYLMRDSIHCGVKFGKALDADRFISGICIDVAHARIALSTKAESYIPTLITVRNLMYNEVYWHKTVRACGAMLKVLIYRLVDSKIIDSEELARLLASQDDPVAFRLAELAKRFEKKKENIQSKSAVSRSAEENRLKPLTTPFTFKGRGLFKMIYVFDRSVANERPVAQKFFKSILEVQEIPLAESLKKASVLEKAIQKFCPSVRIGDILLEATPVKKGHETFELDGIRLWNERTERFVPPSYDLDAADGLLDKSRKVFLFCHPKRSGVCRKLSEHEWDEIFYEAMREPRKSRTSTNKRASK